MNFMLKNRNGSITIMLVAILISTLFLNNTFIEMGRYKAVSNIYGEIQENAAFSILANYDRDLFKNFGLLAIDKDVNVDNFRQYLQMDIKPEGGSKMDTYFDVGSIEANFQKLYFLSQKDVFETQVNEFCEYRAPISIAMDALDIEEVLKDLIKELEESMNFLDAFSSYAKSAKQALKAYKALMDFEDESEKYQDEIEEYVERYNEYIEAVSEAENIWNELKAQEDERTRRMNEEEAGDIPEVDWSPYYGACKSAANAAQSLSDQIQDVINETREFWSKYTDFETAFLTLQSANVSAVFEKAKLNEDTKETAENMQKSYKDSEDTTNKVAQMMKAYDFRYFEDLRNQLTGDQQILSNNINKLNVETKDRITVETVSERSSELKLRNELTLIIDAIVESIAVSQQVVNDNAAFINDMIEVVELYADVAATGGTYDLKYNETITAEQLVGLLDNEVENPYAEGDQRHVDSMVYDEKAQVAAAALGYRTEALGTDDKYAEYSELQEALEEFSKATEGMNNAFNQLKQGGLKLKELINSLLEVVEYVVKYLTAAINAVRLLISNLTRELQKVIYSKVYASTYATEMFTNRSTDISSEKRMNGSLYKNFVGISNGEVFAKANAEYVFGGSPKESENQTRAFLAIMGFRMLANIPAVFKDQGIKSAIEGAAKIPYVGPILAILLFLGILGIESYLDMIFMIYGEEGVYIVKTKLYMSVDGEKELTKQIKGIMGKVYDKIDASEKKTADSGKDKVNLSKDKVNLSKDKVNLSKDKKDPESAADGLYRWDYKQHLFLMLCLFVSADKMYAREADLVQMQMNRIKLDKAENNFKLSEMATYVRTDTTAYYIPLLPVPMKNGIPIRKMYYTGY